MLVWSESKGRDDCLGGAKAREGMNARETKGDGVREREREEGMTEGEQPRRERERVGVPCACSRGWGRRLPPILPSARMARPARRPHVRVVARADGTASLTPDLTASFDR